jgi:hypothetical protein
MKPSPDWGGRLSASTVAGGRSCASTTAGGRSSASTAGGGRISASTDVGGRSSASTAGGGCIWGLLHIGRLIWALLDNGCRMWARPSATRPCREPASLPCPIFNRTWMGEDGRALLWQVELGARQTSKKIGASRGGRAREEDWGCALGLHIPGARAQFFRATKCWGKDWGAVGLVVFLLIT